MLGTLVTPDQLAPNSSSVDSFSLYSSDIRIPIIPARQVHTPSDQTSFISFEDDSPPRGTHTPKDPTSASKWTSKIRQTMGKRSNSNSSISKVAEDQSFFDFRKDAGWKTHKASVSLPQPSKTGMSDEPSGSVRKLSAEDGIFGHQSKSWGKKKSTAYAEVRV